MSKKVLIVTRVSGFVPQFEMNNVKILRQMGYEIHYAANFDQVVYGHDNSRLDDTGIHRHHIPFGRSPFSKDVRRCYQMLRKLMIEEEFDLVHCHMPMTGVLARKAAQSVRDKTGREVPVIYTAHGFHFYKGAPLSNWIYYPIEKHYARYTDMLLLINKEDYERGQTFPVRCEVRYIPGVGMTPEPELDTDFKITREYDIPSDHKVVVSVGELTERKNHQVMIRAMDRFRKDPITYLICGSGPLEGELRTLVKELHLEDRVHFAGYCDHVAEVLRQADIFAFPSKQEGLPAAMMEAMRAGLPVIAMDIRGNKDLTEDGKGGFLLKENLPSEYVKAIRYMMDNPREANQMGQWNEIKVQDYSLDIVEQKMRRVYEDVLTGKMDSQGKAGPV